MSDSSRTPIEHSRREHEQQAHWSTKDRIDSLLDGCARLMATDSGPSAYRELATTCADDIAPLLYQFAGQSPTQYGDELADDEAYDREALAQLIGYPDPEVLDYTNEQTGELVIRAFESLAAVAKAEDVVSEELRNRVDVVGWTVKIGEHLQDWTMDLDAPIGGIADGTEALKTLHCGGTGAGKSTALETEAFDFYQKTHQEGRDNKLIDLVDLDKGENWFPDIPQQQRSLRRIRREEMDLPPDFAVSDDHGTPEVDIRLPLTPELTDERLPYDTTSDGFRVQPFVIPASKIPKRILVPCILARVSDSQERTIRKAYDDVNREKDDWALRDLADEIRERDELSPKHKADAVGVLQSLQDLGFIRTHEHPYTLDWNELFKDTERITIFSQAKLETELGKYFLIAYLVDEILDQRKDNYNLPDAVLLMREMWQVTPQRGRLSPDERAAAVQEALANRMGKVMRTLRHFDLHLIADTQEPGDLHKQVRELFNRYVVFNANRNTLDDIFSWTSNDRKRSFWGTLNMKKGQAGIIGKVQPAVENRDIEFISPVAYVPPSHHHYDSSKDTNGWRTRTKYLSPTEECPECGAEDLKRHDNRVDVECLDCGEVTHDASMGREEELKRPSAVGVDWQSNVPEELAIKDRTERDGPDPTMRPVAAFASECLQVVSEDEYEFTSDVRQAFNDYIESHDREPWDFTQQSKMTYFGKRLTAYYPDDTYEVKNRTRSHGNREKALCGLSFTDKGYQHAKDGGSR